MAGRNHQLLVREKRSRAALGRISLVNAGAVSGSSSVIQKRSSGICSVHIVKHIVHSHA